MKPLEKILCLFLSLCLVFPLMPVQTAAQDTGTEETLPVIVEEALLATDDGSSEIIKPIYGISGIAPGDIVSGVTYVSQDRVPEKLREGLVDRKNQFTVYFKSDAFDPDRHWKTFYKTALGHTGVGDEGDYLLYQLESMNVKFGGTWDDREDCSYMVMEVEADYLTTAQQEYELDQAYAQVLNELELFGKDDYRKVRVIYDYICTNVSTRYDSSDPLRSTAYSALVRKNADSLGIANLFYRMACDAGLDCRIIKGQLESWDQYWNIVRVDGRYYLVDCFGVPHSPVFLMGQEVSDWYTPDPEYRSLSALVANTGYIHKPYDVTVGDFEFHIENYAATLTAYRGGESYVEVPDTAEGVPVKTIGNRAFRGNTTLETVLLPVSVSTIQDGYCQLNEDTMQYEYFGAFAGCTGLNKVISSASTWQYRLAVEHVGDFSFHGCTSLDTVKFSSNYLKTLGLSCFEGCSDLRELDLPEGLETVGQNAFHMAGLDRLHIPSTCYSFHNWAGTMPSLVEFTVASNHPVFRAHEGVLYYKYNDSWVLHLYPQAKEAESYRVADFCEFVNGTTFNGAEGYRNPYLKTLDIGMARDICSMEPQNPFTLASLARVRCNIIVDSGHPDFKVVDDLLLTKDGKILVQIPSTVRGTVAVPQGVEAIAEFAGEFGRFSSLVLPEGLKTIEGYAFCDGQLESVTIPASVTAAGPALFQGNDRPIRITYGGTKGRWQALFETPGAMGMAAVHGAQEFTVTVLQEGQTASVPMHRMYDPNSGEHFYSGSELERDFLVEAGWHYEGVGFNFPVEGAPVYRLYEPVNGEHLYTMDEAEKNKLLDEGWNYEGVAFNSAGNDEVPQYRLHNPNAKRGGYHFTGSELERDILVNAGWIPQGIGWYSCLE